jgi:ABC-2 type transport system permease protein
MNRLQRVVKTASTLLSVQYAYMVEYRAELLLWALSNSLPIILMGLWNQAAQGGQFGLSALDFIRYFLAVFFVRQLTVVWVIWEFEREIVEGRLSFRLLQPIDPGWHYFTGHVAERLARLPFSFILIALFFVLYPQAVWMPSLSDLCWGLFATILAFVFRFVQQYAFAMLAFWTERANAIETFWFLFYLFLSGLMAPLQVYPPVVQAVLQWTPFPYIIWFPASILAGLPVNLWQGVTVLLAWTMVFAWLNRWLWKRGLQRYSGMGA